MRALPEDFGDILWKYSPPSRSYDHLEIVHRCSIIDPLPHSRDNRSRFDDHLFVTLPKKLQRVLAAQAGEFYRVIGTKSSVEKSIKKMDQKPCYDFVRDPLYDTAVEFVHDMFYDSFKSFRQYGTEEILRDMNLRAAAGVPWIKYGFKKKGDVYSSPSACSAMLDAPFRSLPPVWKMAARTQWYPAKKLDANDVRTFIVPPVELVHYCKMIYQYQNEAMKGVFWSAYGFNPYNGGTNILANKLLRLWLKFCYDVVGWDRLLSNMDDVYYIRNLFIPEEFRPIMDWVTLNTINSFILHPDGHIFRKAWGNNSGSGNTTNDNIIAHCIILVFCFYKLFNGDVEMVKRCCAALFGDDNVGAIPKCDITPDSLESVFRDTFSLFGLKLDPFLATFDIEELEFLGFRFQSTPQGYVPRYPIGRLLASFCYAIEKQTTGAAISKAWTLTVMAAADPSDVFDYMSTALKQYFISFCNDPCPTVQGYIALGVPTRAECINFCLGLESSIDSGSFLGPSVLDD